MDDPFIGTWMLVPGASQMDPNHRPSEVIMSCQLEPDGGYLILAEGVNEKGERVSEKPQKLYPDGRPYPVENFPGLSCVTNRPDRNVLRAEVKREDGSIAGEGTYTVGENGTSMTATTAGFDSQLRRFEMRMVFERISAIPREAQEGDPLGPRGAPGCTPQRSPRPA